jgi:hypothetical protein
MYVCQSCAEQFPPSVAPQPKIPALTLGGGVLGGVAAALTGQIALVPVALIAGLLADLRRCSICGANIPHDAPAYRFERRPLAESDRSHQGDQYAPRSLMQDTTPAWTKTSPLFPEPSLPDNQTVEERPTLASLLRLDEFEDAGPVQEIAFNEDITSSPDQTDGLDAVDEGLGSAAGDDAGDASDADADGAPDGAADDGGDL